MTSQETDAASRPAESIVEPEGETIITLNIPSKEKDDDIKNIASEPSARSFSSTCIWLSLWFTINVGVTLFNKRALNALNLPITLTCVHMLCNALGAYLYVHACNAVSRKRLRPDQITTMFFFSLVFVSNIVTGNMSLGLVSVSFNQVMRALVPGATVVFSMLLLGTSYPTAKKAALAPIALGVYVACTGDKSSTVLGCVVTIVAVLFAALKAVLSSKFLTGAMNLHPADLILHQAPLSALWCAAALVFFGEWIELVSASPHQLYSAMGWYVVTGVLSFALNLSSFFANKATSALTLAVCANIKQVAVIVLSVYLHGDAMSFQTVLGVVLVTSGGALYTLMGL
ncbi:Aste57867_21909 [Aphanomyces stellatus]|uniref:Aste57867_21909 protein n=1 Tax=Aphanomyces stellatus TaxID=120398 RepID=A0A485LIT9_9STRA|nr:hypothetical protein As57867_021840 [Aphanomyces stellatus]VFT98577.1 Aste57867_21909 [Aphanomyces stellatus]